MIHVNIDTVSDRNVIGFECGTRTQFDERHSNDPLWVFVDSDSAIHRIKLEDFFLYPTSFLVTERAVLKKKRNPVIR